MTSNKPYMIRALYDWILDNNCTPHVVVDTTLPYVKVPNEFIHDGKIILNILPNAVQNLLLGNEWITFSARFKGQSHDIELPLGSVIAIYAQENGQGMGFSVEALPEDDLPNDEIQIQKPSLSVISTDDSLTHNLEDDDLPPTDPSNSKKKSNNKKKVTTLKVIK